MFFRIQPGSWVQAKFLGKKGNQFFKGVVLDIIDQDVSIKFLQEKGGYFIFPVVDDIHWVPAVDVTLMMAPEIDRRCHHFFK